MSAFSRMIFLALLFAAAGCKSGKGQDAPAAPPAEPTASAPAPSAEPSGPPPATEAPARPEEAPAAVAQKPLREYLAAATSAKVSSVEIAAGGARKKLLKELDAAATTAYLAKVGLDQTASGPVVKCPSDTVVELADAGGKALGSIGYCGTAARFDAPDGTFGGISAPAP